MARRRRRQRRGGTYDSLILIGASVVVFGGAIVTWARSNTALVVVAALIAAVVLVAVWQVRKGRDRRFATTLEGFLSLSPTGFEHAVADVLTASGYRQMRVTGGSGDLSIDLSGRDPTGRAVLVQCKRYTPGKRVGSPDIQQFYGMARFHDESARAILVTTSDFTLPARDVARGCCVELMSGTDLVVLALRVSAPARPAPLVEATTVTPRAADLAAADAVPSAGQERRWGGP